jgi:hypothetical protein
MQSFNFVEKFRVTFIGTLRTAYTESKKAKTYHDELIQ